MNESDPAQGRRHHCRPPKGRAQDDDSLGGLFHRCAHLLHRQAGGKHASQRRVLQLLAERGQLSQRELQELLNIQSGSISELISKLEGKGFVQRQRNEQDRRKVLLTLTETGRAHAEPPHEPQEQMFSVLSQEEQQALRELLEKLEHSWSHMD